MKNIKKHWQITVILILSIFLIWPTLMSGYFFHHDDLQVMRIFQMRKCLEDFQIPCRWVPDMGYGNGYPLFNYYGVMAYYIGGVLSFIFGFVGAAKAIFFIPLIFGGVAMYFLVKELWGENAGLVGGVLYGFAPYRALDAYVRGAIAESFALAIIPLVFYFSLRLIKGDKLGNFLGLVLSLGAFLLSHNIMTLFFIPLYLVWVLFWLIKKKVKSFKPIIVSSILGLGLASFFLLPAFLEKDLVKSESLIQGGTEFRAHFVTVSQLFTDREWDFGASVFGPDDTISFQLGMPHWILVCLASAIVLYQLILKRKINYLIILLLFAFGLSVILMHNKSAFVWEAVKIIQFAQFPWRFLSISIFISSILGGFVIAVFSKKYQFAATVILVILTVLLNWNYFKPKDFYPWVDDKVKLSDPLWEIQQKAGIADYLPKTVWLEPQSRAPGVPEIRKGVVELQSYQVFTNHFRSNFKVKEDATIEFPILDFPVWKVWVNNQKKDHYIDKHWGRISIDLPPGEYVVKGRLTDTPIRMISNIITFFSIIFLIAILKYKKIRKLVF